MNYYLKKIKPICSKLLIHFLIIISFYSMLSTFFQSVNLIRNYYVISSKTSAYNQKKLNLKLKKQNILNSNFNAKSLIPQVNRINLNKNHNFNPYDNLPYKSHSECNYITYNDSTINLPEISDEDINFNSEINKNLPSIKLTRNIKRTVLCYLILILCIVAILSVIAYNIKIPRFYDSHSCAKYKLKKLKPIKLNPNLEEIKYD